MANDAPSAGSDYGPVRFPPTRWSLFIDPRDDPERAAQALRELCLQYRDAIEAWFRLRMPDEAGDLTNQFIEHWLARDRMLNVERRPESRFRFYLAKALGNFRKDHLEREHALKRGGGVQTASIEELRETGFEVPGNDPDQPSALDCQLSLIIHRAVIDSLRRAARDGQRFQQLIRFISFELGDESYADAARVLAMNPGAVRTAVHRLRDDYFEAFRSEVAQMTRPGCTDADEETHYLLEILPGVLERQAATG